MSILDQIRKKQLIQSPETVNSNWVSPAVSLDDREGAFSLTLKYENGTDVQMAVYVQLSTDDLDFGDIIESEVLITDPTGVILYDLEGSGANFARIRIEVTAGSLDVVEVKYSASQRH